MNSDEGILNQIVDLRAQADSLHKEPPEYRLEPTQQPIARLVVPIVGPINETGNLFAIRLHGNDDVRSDRRHKMRRLTIDRNTARTHAAPTPDAASAARPIIIAALMLLLARVADFSESV